MQRVFEGSPPSNGFLKLVPRSFLAILLKIRETLPSFDPKSVAKRKLQAPSSAAKKKRKCFNVLARAFEFLQNSRGKRALSLSLSLSDPPDDGKTDLQNSRQTRSRQRLCTGLESFVTRPNESYVRVSLVVGWLRSSLQLRAHFKFNPSSAEYIRPSPTFVRS